MLEKNVFSSSNEAGRNKLLEGSVVEKDVESVSLGSSHALLVKEQIILSQNHSFPSLSFLTHKKWVE